jgi:pilus assembly protein Flp/PilA
MSDLMLKLFVSMQTLRAREEGQGMVEYALILVLVSVVAIATLGLIGTGVNDTFQAIVDEFTAAL